MKNKLKKVQLHSVLVMLLIGIMLFASCGMVAAQVISRGGTLTGLLIAEPRSLNPYTGAWNIGFVAAQIFNSLLTLDQNLNVLPSLAESWEVDEGEGSYTFYLKKNVKWHDGEPFTAADVKFTFEELQKYDLFGALYFKDVKVEIMMIILLKLYQ